MKTKRNRKRKQSELTKLRLILAVLAVLVLLFGIFKLRKQDPPPVLSLMELPPWRLQKVPGGVNRLTAMAVDSDGTVFLSDSGNKRVLAFTSKGEYLNSFSIKTKNTDLQEPQGLIVLQEHELMVLNPPGGDIIHFMSNGHESKFLNSFKVAGSYYPRGLAFDPLSRVLFVVDTGQGRVVKCDLSGNTLMEMGKHGSRKGMLMDPLSAAIDRQRNCYVSDTGNFRIQKFDAAGRFQSQWTVRATSKNPKLVPAYLTVDSKDRLVVTDTQNSLLWIFTMDGKVMGIVSGFSAPTGICMGKDGFLYVMDSGNATVRKFQPLP